MTAALFSDYLSGKQSVDKLGFEELKTLVVQYPYCRQLRYLLARRELDNNSSAEQLENVQKASVSANNRKAFFNFIRKKKRGFTKLVIEAIQSFSSVKTKKHNSEVVQNVTVISNRTTLESGMQQEQKEETQIIEEQTGSKNHQSNDKREKKHAYIHWLKSLRKARLAGESSSDSDHPVISETLARLLVRQGKQEEAMRMIHQLILLNPEKKAYFASIIEKVKQEP